MPQSVPPESTVVVRRCLGDVNDADISSWHRVAHATPTRIGARSCAMGPRALQHAVRVRLRLRVRIGIRVRVRIRVMVMWN